MKTTNQTNSKKETQRHLVEAIIAYVAFCGLSVLSRFVLPVFLLVMVFGLAFPLLWAKFAREWTSIGFKRRNRKKALLWGFVAGLIGMIYAFIYSVITSIEEWSVPPMLGLQLALGIPIWILIMSPFQEFLFRGWLQPRFQDSIGKWAGLFVTSICFTLWHFCPPLESTATATIPITSVGGVLSTFGLGMLFGYVFQRTDNIVAPWLAHAFSGVGLILAGTLSFIQYTP